MEKFNNFIDKSKKFIRQSTAGVAMVGASVLGSGEVMAQKSNIDPQEQEQKQNTKEVTLHDINNLLKGYDSQAGQTPLNTCKEQLKDFESKGFKFIMTEAVGQIQAAAEMQAQQNLINAGMGKHKIYTFTKKVGENIEVLKIEIHK